MRFLRNAGLHSLIVLQAASLGVWKSCKTRFIPKPGMGDSTTAKVTGIMSLLRGGKGTLKHWQDMLALTFSTSQAAFEKLLAQQQ